MISATLANQVLHAIGAGGHPAGQFYTHLIAAAMHADAVNRQKIAIAFPDVAAATVMSIRDLRAIANQEKAHA